jgi:hypothetical protein
MGNGKGESIQASGTRADSGRSVLENRLGDRRRTIVALVSASVISVVTWGLVVALHLQ